MQWKCYMQTTILHIHSTEVRKKPKATWNQSQKKQQKPKTKSQESSEAKAKSQKPNGHANWLQTAANSTQIRDFGSKMQQIQARSQKPKEPEAKSQKPNGHANWLQTAANSTQIRDFGSKMQQIQARSQKPKEPEAKSQKPEANKKKMQKKKTKKNTPPKSNPKHLQTYSKSRYFQFPRTGGSITGKIKGSHLQQIPGHADDLSESHSPKQGVTWPYLQSLGEFQQPKQGDVTCIQLVVLCYKLQTWGSICFNHSIFLFHGTKKHNGLTLMVGFICVLDVVHSVSHPTTKELKRMRNASAPSATIFVMRLQRLWQGKPPIFLVVDHRQDSPTIRYQTQLVKYDIVWYSMI